MVKKIHSFCLIHFKFVVLCSICFDISMLNYGTRRDPFLDELQLIILASWETRYLLLVFDREKKYFSSHDLVAP